MSYETLIQEADTLEAQAQLLRNQAEAEHKSASKKNGIETWLNYTFKSSSGLTEEFAAFSTQAKRELKKSMQGYTLLNYNRGHFYFSAFFKNNTNQKIVYILCSDVRSFKNEWYENLLIRTAKHSKDYSGGSNCFSSWKQLKERADYLIN